MYVDSASVGGGWGISAWGSTGARFSKKRLVSISEAFYYNQYMVKVRAFATHRIYAMIPSQLSIVLCKLFILVVDRFPAFILNE